MVKLLTKSLTIQADLLINGVYNFQGTQEKKEMPGKKSQKNVKFAKQDRQGRDFTSGAAINYEAYADIMPNQPVTDVLNENYHLIAGSPYYPRGWMVAQKSVKKSSALTVLDAYTCETYLQKSKIKSKEDAEYDIEKFTALFLENRSSSKPKETGLKSSSKHKDGADAKDTSLFAKQNAGRRIQKLEMFIQLEKLEFISFEGQGFASIEDERINKFKDQLKKTFSVFGVDNHLNEGTFLYKTAIIQIPMRGIQLTQDQRRAFVLDILERYSSLDGRRANSRLWFDRFTKISCDFSSSQKRDLNIDSWVEEVNKLQFHDFYEKIEA